MLNLSKQERARQRYKAIRPGYRMALEIYKEMMDGLVTPETRLLDAGCGPAGLVKEYVGTARLVVGADRYVTSWTEPAEIPILAESELAALPFADNTFDLITCSWVLEHLAEPLAVFREVSRVLKPGGHFLFITPNKLNYAVWMRRLVPSAISQRVVHAIYGRNEDFINPTFYQANTTRDVDRALTAAGLTCRRLEHVGDPTYLAVNELAFRAAVLLEGAIDRLWPQSRVHLVGMYEKKI
jgi:SAM-dependent methyltransferase